MVDLLPPGLRILVQSAQFLLVVRIAITLWLLAVSWVDARNARIPNALVGPVMLGMGAYRLLEGLLGEWQRFFLLLAWAVLFGLWMLNFFGGGDAKFLMAQFALFPTMQFTGLLAFILLLITLPLLLLEMRGRSVSGVLRGFRSRVITGQVLPTREELIARGRPYAWTFAVPGLIYVWRYWGQV